MRSVIAVHLQFTAKLTVSQAAGGGIGTPLTVLSYGDTKANKQNKRASFMNLLFFFFNVCHSGAKAIESHCAERD